MLTKFFKFIFMIINKIIVFFFGRVSWTPPAWLRILFSPFTRFIKFDASLYQKSKFKFYLLNLFLSSFVVAGLYAYDWYIHLPQPNYINYTIGKIPATSLLPDSKPSPLNVTFDSSAANINLVTKNIEQGINIMPALAGVWTWQSDRNLVFTPTNDWQVGQKYNVTLSPQILAKHVLLEKQAFEFSTPEITGTLIESKFYEDPIDPKLKQAVVSFRFTHPLDKSDFERHVKIAIKKVNDKKYEQELGFKVLYNDKGNEAYVRSEAIGIPERDSEVKVTLAKDIHANTGGLGTNTDYEGVVSVPGVDNYFKIQNVDEKIITNPKTYVAERFLSVGTSTAVKKVDMSKGIEILLLPEKPKDSDEQTYYDEGTGEESEYNEGTSVDPEVCWQSPAAIPNEILGAATKLELKNETNEEDLTTHLFKYSAAVKRCLLVKIKAGTPSFSGYSLSADRVFLVATQEFDKDIKILNEGALLAASGSKKLSIMGRNQQEVSFTLYRIFPETINHLLSQTATYGKFENPAFENYKFGPENISEVFTRNLPLNAAEPGLPQYTSFDFSEFINESNGIKQGLFLLKVQGYQSESNSRVGPEDNRLVIISDLGLLVKTSNDKEKDVFVLSFKDKTGIASADVSVIGKNGLAVHQTKTDENGVAHLPALTDAKNDREPVAIVVKNGQDLSFIPWQRYDRKLNLSRFDIGGIYTNTNAKSLLAYLFSDRGIYRPGEKASFGIIVKDRNWITLQNVPLELSLINPRGSIVKTEKAVFTDAGFRDFEYTIPEEAILGGYSLELNLIDEKKRKINLGSTPFKVEEFLPDRIKIKAEFNQPKKIGWLKPSDLKVQLKLENMFGTVAAGNKTTANLKLYPALPDFSKYPDFNFSDPFNTQKSFDESLGEQLTDDQGNQTYDLNLGKYEQGNFYLRVLVEGFEKEGGRSVLTNVSSVISPLDYLIGWKPDADFSYIKQGAYNAFEILAVDQDLNITEARKISIERFRTDYVSILSKQSNGDMAYTSVPKRVSLEKTTLDILHARKLKMFTAEPGEYEYVVTNQLGLVLARIPYYVVGEGNVSRDLERNAELKVKINKNDYAAGEEIELNIQAPYTGLGLITIEKDRVYESKWFYTDFTSSVQKITVPENLEGNAYVNVSFVRALDSEEIFMSPLSYGVVPFSISRQKRTVNLKLTAAEKIVPGTDAEINLTSDRTVKAVVFAVDEGIHQVARYKQPDPLAYFFRKQALEVETSQMLDLLIPEFEIVNKFSAPGGDEDSLLGKFKNPFKRKTQPPVVYWSGVKTIQDQQKFSFKVPNYFNGNLKIYAVAVDEASIGIASAQTLVQNDLVLMPTTPLVVGPQDDFSVSTSISNTTKDAKQVKVSLKLDANLQGTELEKIVDLAAGAEQLVRFDLKALDQLGNSDLNFIASTNTMKAEYTMSLAIRPLSAKSNDLETDILRSGTKEQIIKLNTDYYQQLAHREFVFSPSPLAWTWGLSKFLESYPYGCTEQIVSQALAKLALQNLSQFNLNPKDTNKFIEQVFAMLMTRQNQDGSISLWPQTEFSDDAIFPTLHAARFAIEASEAGYTVSETFKSELNNYLTQLAAGSSIAEFDLINRAYATYLIARSRKIVANYLSALKEDLLGVKLTDRGNSIIKLLIAASYKLQKQDSEADSLLKDVKFKFEDQTVETYYLDNFSIFGFYLDILSRHFPEQAKKIPTDTIISNLKELQAKKYHTYSSALFIYAISKYTEMFNAEQQSLNLLTSEDCLKFTPVEFEKNSIYKYEISDKVKCLKLTEAAQNIYYQLTSTGFKKLAAINSASAGYEIQREYLDKSGKVLTSFQQGDDVYVHLSVRGVPGSAGKQAAITDLLPAGLEIVGGSSELATEVANISSDFYPIYKQAYEDRVVLIGYVSETVQHFVYKTKASSAGTFYVPVAQVESMYDLNMHANTGITKLEIRR